MEEQIKQFKEQVNSLSPVEKIQTLVQMIDTPIGHRKYPQSIIILAQSLKEDFPYNPNESLTELDKFNQMVIETFKLK